MFVEALKRQNPALISAALSLWQQGKIAPDSWVIDVDQILENGKRLIETARLYGIELYLMTKQFGRNPWLAEKLLALGYSGIVAVDYKEARVMRRAGLPVAHQGHLVQIPCHQVADAVEQGTDVITVFTDITCGYCHKLHEQMADYNALGITVRYLAFPRQGLDSDAEKEMKAIWCAKDKNKAFDDVMAGKSVAPASCDVDIADHYALGVQLGVSGTPAVVLSNGTLVPGYQPPKEMKEFLDEHQKMTSGK